MAPYQTVGGDVEAAVSIRESSVQDRSEASAGSAAGEGVVDQEIEGARYRRTSAPRTQPFMRAANAGVKLTDQDAAIIKGMLRAKNDRGQPIYRQSDIASYFGVNSGRLTEIKRGQKFRHVQAAPLDSLPPPGPYVVVDRASHDQGVLARFVLDEMMQRMTEAAAAARKRLEVGCYVQ